MDMKRDFCKILILFVIWLLLLVVFSWLGFSLFHPINQTSPVGVKTFFTRFNAYDGSWFIDIARFGYTGFSEARGWDNPYISTAFFPLYPLMIRIFSYPLAGNFNAAALVVAWLAAIFALFYLYLLASSLRGEKTAYRSCLFLLTFPTAIFLALGYSESIFLLCAIAAFYHARRSSWILAGVWGFFACLARPVGLAVFVGIALEALRQAEWKLSGLRARMAAILMAPAGLLAYMIYLQVAFGDFLVFTKAESGGWKREFNPFAFFQAIKQIFTSSGVFTNQFAQFSYLVFFTVLFAVLIVFIFKRYGLPLGAFSLICFLTSLLSSPVNEPLLSMNRLVLVIFPAFIVMAEWGRNRNFERLYLVAGTLGLAFFTLMFLNFYWAG